jgi:hypothetical protein
MSAWRPYQNGSTIGRNGSEDGVIVGDFEHETGARLSLERNCAHGVPFAVTCGIYGWFFHTRFLSSAAEAELPAMLDSLDSILAQCPRDGDSDCDAKMSRVTDLIREFIERFP